MSKVSLNSHLPRRLLNVLAGISVVIWCAAFLLGALLPVRPGSFLDVLAEHFRTPWVLLLLIAPIVGSIFFVLERIDERRIARRGKCSACGYDLYATPIRCPECGLERP